jgi:predicted N-acetyltransferase YhbS
MKFTVEKALLDDEDFADLWPLMVELHKSGGFAQMDVDKTVGAIHSVINEGMVFLARDEAGVAIGTLGLTELRFWYSQDSYLQDAWLYVRPKYRKQGVGVLLMRAGRDEAQRRGKVCMITVHNPDRRQKKTRMALESQTAGFVPFGYTIKLT